MGGLTEAAKRRGDEGVRAALFSLKEAGLLVLDACLSSAMRHDRSLGVVLGMTIVDCGAETGRRTIPFSYLVGSVGRVYALNEKRERVEAIARRVRRQGLHNVVAAVGLPFDTGLPNGIADLIRLPGRLLGSGPQEAILRELHRISAPKALLVLDDVPRADGCLSLAEAIGWKQVATRSGQLFYRRTSAGGRERSM